MLTAILKGISNAKHAEVLAMLASTWQAFVEAQAIPTRSCVMNVHLSALSASGKKEHAMGKAAIMLWAVSSATPCVGPMAVPVLDPLRAWGHASMSGTAMRAWRDVLLVGEDHTNLRETVGQYAFRPAQKTQKFMKENV